MSLPLSGLAASIAASPISSIETKSTDHSSESDLPYSPSFSPPNTALSSPRTGSLFAASHPTSPRRARSTSANSSLDPSSPPLSSRPPTVLSSNKHRPHVPSGFNPARRSSLPTASLWSDQSPSSASPSTSPHKSTLASLLSAASAPVSIPSSPSSSSTHLPHSANSPSTSPSNLWAADRKYVSAPSTLDKHSPQQRRGSLPIADHLGMFSPSTNHDARVGQPSSPTTASASSPSLSGRQIHTNTPPYVEFRPPPLYHFGENVKQGQFSNADTTNENVPSSGYPPRGGYRGGGDGSSSSSSSRGGSKFSYDPSGAPPTSYGEHPFGEHPSRTLFVRNINSNVEDEELRTLFEQYGPIRSMYTQCKHRGFVMISYFDIRHAKTSMRTLQGRVLRRRKLDIHYSIPKENPSEKDQNQGTLVVFNLDPSISNEELRDIFGKYGEIKEIRETPNKKHHKFIEFYDVRDAEKAMKNLNKTEIKSKKIKIEPSRPGGARKSLMQKNAGPGRRHHHNNHRHHSYRGGRNHYSRGGRGNIHHRHSPRGGGNHHPHMHPQQHHPFGMHPVHYQHYYPPGGVWGMPVHQPAPPFALYQQQQQHHHHNNASVPKNMHPAHYMQPRQVISPQQHPNAWPLPSASTNTNSKS
eukprot:CAMPEP_0201550488 /NCGR_PEP_ID=MMETSP0173_2-20130828/6836_1 /ASSEMBLY_ACC=CAM_ASM_000268 /TAXON_ID=218659 /ORGANISM="Vexillifera sp., Strain DIVA3 564/2" /LENGTH=638 /DNA_ID=CAMNT_0047960469 /DNA_START=381 /DNA_END=2297 /DNA_ORIENTATION=+